MKPEFVRNPYNYESDKLSEETGLDCKDESLAQQQFLEESDINYIAERFLRTGEMPQVLNLPTPGDFSGIFDFQTAMNTIAEAKQEFMRLPAKIRSRFENDPGKLLEFVNDPDNFDEAVKLGFIDKEKADGRRAQQSNPQHAQGTPGNPRAQTAPTTPTGDQGSGPKAPAASQGGASQAGS